MPEPQTVSSWDDPVETVASWDAPPPARKGRPMVSDEGALHDIGAGLLDPIVGAGEGIAGAGNWLLNAFNPDPAKNSLAQEGNRMISEGKQAYQSVKGGKYADAVGHALAINPLEPVIEGYMRESQDNPVKAAGKYVVAPMVMGQAGDEARQAYTDLGGTPALKTAVSRAQNEARGIRQPPEAPSPQDQLATKGATRLFQAAAPTSMEQGFKENLDAAKGDLAEIGRKVDLDDSKGSFWKTRPDQRVRTFTNAIDDHTKQMYEEERAPQIERNADRPVPTQFGPDARRGLEYLADNAADEASRKLAAKALESDALKLSETDKLAKLVNKELIPYESMEDDKQAIVRATNPKIGGLKPLDQELGGKINDTLQSRGEPGIQSYERRMAALKQIRNRFGKRINQAELESLSRIPGLDFVRSLWGGSKDRLAGASQAAVARVVPGQAIQKGLNELSRSGAKPFRPSGGIFQPDLPLGPDEDVSLGPLFEQRETAPEPKPSSYFGIRNLFAP